MLFIRMKKKARNKKIKIVKTHCHWYRRNYRLSPEISHTQPTGPRSLVGRGYCVSQRQRSWVRFPPWSRKLFSLPGVNIQTYTLKGLKIKTARDEICQQKSRTNRELCSQLSATTSYYIADNYVCSNCVVCCGKNCPESLQTGKEATVFAG